MDANSESQDIEIHAPAEMLVEGLKCLGWDNSNMTTRLTAQTKKDRFQGHFGSDPQVAAQIWEDPQTTKIELARVPPSQCNLLHFFWAMHFLKKYPKSVIEAEQIWKVSENTCVNCSWYYVEKVRALQRLKLR